MSGARAGLEGARVLLGVTGGVAAYKAPELVRAFAREGARVSVILTRTARRFVTRDALRSVTRGLVLSDLFEPRALGPGPWFDGDPPSPLGMAHVGMAREADLVLVAPATAHLIGKLAHGLADDLLSTALLATRAPVLIAPAMNVAMWEHPAVRANIDSLRARGVRLVDPEEGELADGEWGAGRMAAIEAIVAAARAALSDAAVIGRAESTALKGRTIVVTAGGTEEPIDPVRVITNRSSGKMGFALAEEAHLMGARVLLIAARASIPTPGGVERIEALTASAMTEAVLEAMEGADALVMAAAVSDYAPVDVPESKIPRTGEGLTLSLRATQDILGLVRERHPTIPLVGFALETDDEERRGMEKLEKKRLDLIAINNPLRPGAGFGSDLNDVILVDRHGQSDALGLRPKREIARAILVRLGELLDGSVNAA